MIRWVIGCGALAACGRVGFDAVGSSSIDSSNDGSSSCHAVLETCGPAGVPCCDSPIVPGSTFFRGFDHAGDLAFADTSSPATLSAFRLDRFEVTVARFRMFVDAGLGTQTNPPVDGTGARPLNGELAQGGWSPTWNPILATDTAGLRAGLACEPTYQTWTDAPGPNERRPITCITWYEAAAFCAWDGGFLPTEAEWHYVASGAGSQRAYPWSLPSSSTTLDCTLANFGGPTWPSTACAPGPETVGSRSPAGDGVWGHADLAGNVSEWVLDTVEDLPLFGYPLPCDDCANLTMQSYRARRGGSFGSVAMTLRAANRDSQSPGGRYDHVGVRCARAVP